MKKPMGQSARTVQASTEDVGVIEFTGQDKLENTIWYRINKKYFILQNKHQVVKGNSEETSDIYPTHQLLFKSSLECITIHQDVIQQ